MQHFEMTIAQGATAEGMIVPYGITCFPHSSFHLPLTSPSVNDSVEKLSAMTARPTVLSHQVRASVFNTGETDNSDVPPEFLIIPPPTSPLQFNFRDHTNTYDTIIQQGANSTEDQPNAPDQMAVGINMTLDGHFEECIQPRVSEPDPQIGPATEPATRLAPPRFSKTCKWEGCQYPHPFGREADLVRHLKTVHINPGAYICPELGCGKPCSRKDNLEAHRQRVHGRGSET
jgi:hypothetical protein